MSNYDEIDYYDYFGINKSATKKDILNAYKKLILVNHPDKNNNSIESQEKTKIINSVKDILLNNLCDYDINTNADTNTDTNADTNADTIADTDTNTDKNKNKSTNINVNQITTCILSKCLTHFICYVTLEDYFGSHTKNVLINQNNLHTYLQCCHQQNFNTDNNIKYCNCYHCANPEFNNAIFLTIYLPSDILADNIVCQTISWFDNSLMTMVKSCVKILILLEKHKNFEMIQIGQYISLHQTIEIDYYDSIFGFQIICSHPSKSNILLISDFGNIIVSSKRYIIKNMGINGGDFTISFKINYPTNVSYFDFKNNMDKYINDSSYFNVSNYDEKINLSELEFIDDNIIYDELFI
jgi:hypothetical protein